MSSSKARLSRQWSVHPRLLVSLLLTGLVAIILPTHFSWATRILCLWDTGMACFLGLTWWVMLRATADTMRRNARRQDEGRLVILSLITAAACASLLAIFFMLKESKGAPVDLVLLHITVSIVTIVGSWLLVHTIFALHYAHEYYQHESESTQKSQAGGLDFPGDPIPDYWDFMYFSFVIGMTSQVSDVAVSSRVMRRLSLLHGILSFFFNTTIVAMSINIIAGLI